MREVKILSGFRDILPNDALEKEFMIDKLKLIFKSFGFVPIETPHLEYADVLIGKGGEEIQKEIYSFRDNGNRNVALRFDQTVPLARFVIQNQNSISSPFKRYAIGNVFRGERAQSGRYREFTQCDFDFIKTTSISSDIEIIQIINNSMISLGVENFTIKINNLKILNGLIRFLGIENRQNNILRIIDKIKKIGKEKVKSELINIDIDLNSINQILNLILLKYDDDIFFQKLNRYKNYNSLMNDGILEILLLVDRLKLLNIKSSSYQIDLSITRGLSYYTGIVYETILNNLESIGSVCSGGRYDNLTKYFSEESVAGVGASIGLDRLITALKFLKIDSIKNKKINILILNIDSNYIPNIYQLGEKLREQNLNIEIYPDVVKMKKQMKYANFKNHNFVIILGEDEIKYEKIKIKNMLTGQQYFCKNIDEIIKLTNN